jgi:hypothetical protein
VNSREYRAWLSGLLEGLAGRVIDQASLDGYISRIEKNHPAAFGPVMRQSTKRPDEDTDPDEFLDGYDGPGAPPVNPDSPEPVAKPMTVEELRALRGPDGKAKKVPKVERIAPRARPVNKTRVVNGMDNVPEANPDKGEASEDSAVVRMG